MGTNHLTVPVFILQLTNIAEEAAPFSGQRRDPKRCSDLVIGQGHEDVPNTNPWWTITKTTLAEFLQINRYS